MGTGYSNPHYFAEECHDSLKKQYEKNLFWEQLGCPLKMGIKGNIF